jgi:hypothetical protein
MCVCVYVCVCVCQELLQTFRVNFKVGRYIVWHWTFKFVPHFFFNWLWKKLETILNWQHEEETLIKHCFLIQVEICGNMSKDYFLKLNKDRLNIEKTYLFIFVFLPFQAEGQIIPRFTVEHVGKIWKDRMVGHNKILKFHALQALIVGNLNLENELSANKTTSR